MSEHPDAAGLGVPTKRWGAVTQTESDEVAARHRVDVLSAPRLGR